ncbi:MAG: hypothetical protein H6994_20300 [Pseudomonadales bacterium]|nr:hypothetical protein [Pseudomonadales bacterium]
MRKLALTAALIAAACLAVMRPLDDLASSNLSDSLRKSLATYAVVRGLNAMISVAQGTELALQPAGIGVTLTVGEVLDPLNDLVERFSWVVLAAAASLGVQRLLVELFSTNIANALTVVAALWLIATLWRPAISEAYLSRRIGIGILFARFAITLVVIGVGWIDESFLSERQNASIRHLEATNNAIETTSSDAGIPAGEPGLLERITNAGKAMDPRPRLADLQQRVEASVEEIVSMIAVFFLQTLILPLGFAMLGYGAFRRLR